MIEQSSAAAAFEALGYESRLSILRLLIPAGPDGVQAGEIADALELAPSRLSFHLNRLMTAGLVERRRSGRRLYYAVRYEILAGLARFLIEDCCSDAPAGCMPDCPGMRKCGSDKSARQLKESPEEKEERNVVS